MDSKGPRQASWPTQDLGQDGAPWNHGRGFGSRYGFYTGVLGFQEIWRGSKDGKVLSWANSRTSEGEDYVEFMLYRETPPKERWGTMHHICPVVPDIDKAVAGLEARPTRKDCGRKIEIQTGVNRNRQCNHYDPDETRVELMEPRTVDVTATPPSTAPAPK